MSGDAATPNKCATRQEAEEKERARRLQRIRRTRLSGMPAALPASGSREASRARVTVVR
jgi:hypothetical protein